VKRIDSLELKLNQRPWEMEAPKTIGQQILEHEGIKNYLKSSSREGYTATLKGPLFGQKDITLLSQQFVQPIPQIAVGPRLPLGVRTLVPQGRTTAGSVEYISETSFTNTAAPVAEAAAKPKSDKVFAVNTAVVRTIAHFFKVSKQVYDDLPAIVAQIEANGLYGVAKAEDNQLLNGSGTPPNLTGFMTVAAAAPAAAAPLTMIDAIGGAVFDLAAKGFMADGIVLNPADYGAIALLKNSQGMYLFANPIDYSPAARMWGSRLVLSSSMAATNFLVGAFQGHSLLLDREEVNVQIATQNEDDFIRNMVTILVEERIALLIFNTTAFEKGVKPVLLEAQAEGEAPRRGR
jgi:HK97 family phage major capsid protein